METAKTLVVGVGEVGGALAEVLERKMPVLCHDLEPVSFAAPIDVMHLCFPFHAREEFESAALAYISRFAPALAIINSTVLPGTTREIARRSAAAVVYSPVRGKHARMTDDLMRYVKFLAGDDPAALRRAERHFQRAGMRTRRVNRTETLELAKLSETSYFGLLIAFAQELNRYCEQVGADYEEAAAFFKEIDFLPSAHYFPGFIGGHCVIPNINLLLELARSPLFEAVLDSNRRRAAELGHEATVADSANRTGHEFGNGKLLAHR